jgi:putative oxidoreductase
MQKSWVLTGIRVLLTLAFVAAGLAKLFGVQMLVDEFETIGLGQWFRYVTGLVEIGSAVLLWVPGMTAYGAGLLVCTMIGALIAHATKLGLDTAPPAVVLGLLAAYTLYVNRAQLNR